MRKKKGGYSPAHEARRGVEEGSYGEQESAIVVVLEGSAVGAVGTVDSHFEGIGVVWKRGKKRSG